jgi:hypothetical protein
LHCLFQWFAAFIHFGCDFCRVSWQHISLITACNKSYYGVLRMREFRAGRLKTERLILPATSKLASDRIGLGSVASCALPFQLHCFVLPGRRPPSLPTTVQASTAILQNRIWIRALLLKRPPSHHVCFHHQTSVCAKCGICNKLQGSDFVRLLNMGYCI